MGPVPSPRSVCLVADMQSALGAYPETSELTSILSVPWLKLAKFVALVVKREDRIYV